MQCSVGLLFVCACALFAQIPDPAVSRAQAELERIQALVDAGAAPRTQLERAERAMTDARDQALLRRTLYGEDLTEDLIGEMIAAAERRLERRKQEFVHAQRLIAEGVASQLTLGSYLEELDRAQKECDLAESRARLCRQLTEMAKAEQEAQEHLEKPSDEAPRFTGRFDGDGLFTSAHFQRLETAFRLEFSRPLPVSAMGETAVHRALGFDHRSRVDVAVHPDQREGIWLLRYLSSNRIPYFAFRQAVRGKATGAHIHVGPMSTRLAGGG
jgi:hypothetical protein